MSTSGRKIAKYKIDRSLSKNTLGRKKSTVHKRPFKPGVHGHKKVKRISDYGLQIQECRMLKHMYGDMRAGMLKKTVLKALNSKGKAEDNLVALLESRLDSFVYRAKWAATPFQSRQFVVHQHVKVNGEIVDRPSYQLKVGDQVELLLKSDNKNVLDAINSNERSVPVYIKVDGLSGQVLAAANNSTVPYINIVNYSLIFNFYLR